MVIVEGAEAFELASGAAEGDVLADEVNDVDTSADLGEDVGGGGQGFASANKR
jgi:hypothetical protein